MLEVGYEPTQSWRLAALPDFGALSLEDAIQSINADRLLDHQRLSESFRFPLFPSGKYA
jgi:hypothetical protein